MLQQANKKLLGIFDDRCIVNEKINGEIVRLWNKYFGDREDVYAPMFYDEFKRGGLLFVGMNPSFSEKGFKTILKGTKHESINPEEFFKWKNISSDLSSIDICLDVEKCARKNYHSYFRKLNNIAESIGLPWQHVDLFLYKETNQNKFLPLVLEKGELNEFAKEQIQIFTEILKEIRPKIIIVANAGASEIMRRYFKDNLSFDQKRGCHSLFLENFSAPIFFSSMLSGQRALDLGSFERLLWHVGQVAL